MTRLNEDNHAASSLILNKADLQDIDRDSLGRIMLLYNQSSMALVSFIGL